MPFQALAWDRDGCWESIRRKGGNGDGWERRWQVARTTVGSAGDGWGVWVMVVGGGFSVGESGG